jgi:putative SOS response-associated peptidase YedK
MMAALHNRMPVIVDQADLGLWLGDDDASLEAVAEMLRPCPEDWLHLVPIDPPMGNVRNQGAEFCQPLAEPA